MVYPALLPLMRTPRLPVIDWTDAPADLNGLVRFAERRNLVSARVPPRFNRRLPELMSADAFVMVCRPVYRTNLTHVAALIWFFFLKGSCSCHSVCYKQTRVFIFCRKARTVWRMWHLAAPVCDGRNSLIWCLKTWDFVGDDTLLSILFTSSFPVFIYF